MRGLNANTSIIYMRKSLADIFHFYILYISFNQNTSEGPGIERTTSIYSVFCFHCIDLFEYVRVYVKPALMKVA
jgi:hypothetical protein